MNVAKGVAANCPDDEAKEFLPYLPGSIK